MSASENIVLSLRAVAEHEDLTGASFDIVNEAALAISEQEKRIAQLEAERNDLAERRQIAIDIRENELARRLERIAELEAERDRALIDVRFNIEKWTVEKQKAREVEQALASERQQREEAAEWQPIETAPRDGSIILIDSNPSEPTWMPFVARLIEGHYDFPPGTVWIAAPPRTLSAKGGAG